MSYKNKILQGVGVAIIIISIAAVAYSTHAVQNGVISIYQPPNTASTTKTELSNNNKQSLPSSSSNPNTSVVVVPAGAGREGSVSEFFVPSRVNVHVGNTVKWLDSDTVSHTITSATFNGLIWPQGSSQGPSTFSHTFDKSGTFSYFCQIHPYMTGVAFVDVQETERVLNSTLGSSHFVNVRIEMPRNAAYENNYGPYFIPSYALVPLDARVTWVNKDYVAHTATATDGSFNTGPILPDESYTIPINHNPGSVGYFCQIHPWMQAMMYVSSSQPSPSSAFLKHK
jgi:plastocyanin